MSEKKSVSIGYKQSMVNINQPVFVFLQLLGAIFEQQ